ncbi:MAG: hypothetical protein JXR70_14540 [Spirochaetales bacterium]|nr:hypothetical protein [Spirochaetales bacterium]
MKKVEKVIFGFIVFSLLASCWSPLISEQELVQVQDSESPQIILNYPLDQSVFYNSIHVDGSVRDSAGNGVKGRVMRLEYEVSGTDLKGLIRPNDNGAFRAELDASRLSGTISLVIRAVDWNSNLTQIKVALTKSDFTSFSIEPENKSIRVHWKSDYLISQVDLYYCIGGASPAINSGQVIYNIEQDYVLKYLDNEQTIPLKNGQVYGIQLAAHSKSDPGLVFYSEMVKAMPLSPFTLVPQVEGDYGQVRLFWRHFDGIDSYRVLRFAEQSGNYDYGDAARYSYITGDITKNTHTDSEVKPGQGYYYRIQAVIDDRVQGSSGWAYGKASSIPELGRLLGQAAFKLGIRAIDVSGDYAYGAARLLGFQVIDLKNKTNPQFYGGPVNVPGDVVNVVVHGSYLAVCALSGGTHLYDITQPSHPVFLKTFHLDQGHESCNAVFYDDFMAVVEESGLVIYNLNNSDAPVDQYFLDSGHINEVLWDESGLYLASDKEGLLIFDFDASRLSFVKKDDSINNARSLAKEGSLLYTSQPISGLTVYDVTENPANISFLASQTDISSKKVLHIEVKGGFVFAADENGCLSIYRFNSEKSSLEFFGSVDAIENTMFLAIEGELGYSLSGDSRLSVFSVLNPGMYHRINSINTLGVNDVKIQGPNMFLAQGTGGFSKYDISQIDSPVFQSHFNLPSFDVKKVECYSEWAVVLGSTQAVLCSTDYRGPEGGSQGSGKIAFLAAIDLQEGSPLCAAFYSDFLYMAINKAGSTAVFVYDLSDYLSLVENGALTRVSKIDGGFVSDISVIDDLLFLSDLSDRIKKASLKEPLTLDLKSGPSCFEAQNMSSFNHLLFVSDGRFGLKLFDLELLPELKAKEEGISFSKTAAQAGFFYSFSDTGGLRCFGFDLQDEFRCFGQFPFSAHNLAAQDRVLVVASPYPDRELSIFVMEDD